jgi:hypothetical protein
MRYDLVLVTDYRPDGMFSTSGEEVPHLNGHGAGLEQFPPGLTVRLHTRSIAGAIRQSWAILPEMGFVISDQRPPVLPLTQHWVDGSTPQGIILAERGITILPMGPLERGRYQSSAILLTIDADREPASAQDVTIESVVPHTVAIQAGRVLSRFGGGRHHRWREIMSVEREPALQPSVERLVHDLEPPKA